MRIALAWLCVLAWPVGVAQAAEQEPIVVTLRLQNRGNERLLEILVTNRSQRAIEIPSKGIRPAFSVAEWFRWTVDGREAVYHEAIADIPQAAETWRIPPGGVVLWGEIPLKWISFETKSGYESAIQDDKRHTIRILPSPLWKDIKVKPGQLDVGK
jgi:hypothetical protein